MPSPVKGRGVIGCNGCGFESRSVAIMKRIRVEQRNLDLVMGAALMDVEHLEEGCADGSEELVLHFDNGQELSVYFNRAENRVIVEGD